MCQRRNKLWVMIKIWLHLFEKNSNLSTYPWLCDLSSKCYTAWKGAFDVCRSQDIAGDCPGKRVPQCFQICLKTTSPSNCCQLCFLWNDVSLAFDKLFQVISLSVFFSTPISAEDEKHKPLKICTIKKPVANVCLSQCLPFGNRCDLICNCFQRIFLQSIRIYVYMVILSENSF